MALEASVKKAIIDEYATHPGDTGSPEVQVAMMTQRIKDLTGVSTTVSVGLPESIERTLVGKARRVIDKRPK